MGQKMFLFDQIIVIRNEPARPGQAVALLDGFFSASSKNTASKFQQNFYFGFKFIVSKYKSKISISFEIKAFLLGIVFAFFSYIFAYNSRIT